ncbi:MAG: EpsG family protein [Marinilabiliaceae bacterium]|nr:EpsG family protein [Marinilabiliaceae bacterium]
MIAHLVLGFLSLLLLFVFPDKKKGLIGAFVIITAFLGIRYMWGNDYPGYLSEFIRYGSFDFGLFDIEKSGALRNEHQEREFGWVILNRIFGALGLGFFGFIIVLSTIENIIIYHLISKYVDPKYYWVAFFFYVFSVQFCINASMLRQYLCICMYMLVVELMIEKKVKYYLLWSIGIILLGSTIHQSNIAMLISLPLYYIHVKQGESSIKWIILVLLLYVLWSSFASGIATNILNGFESSEDYSTFAHYMEDHKSRTGIGTIYNYLLFAVWLWMLPQYEKRRQTMIILCIFPIFMEPVFLGTGLERFMVYFQMFNMIVWAWLIQKTKEKKLLLIYVLFVAHVYKTFVMDIPSFYYLPVWTERFLEYHTIFEADSWL